MLLTVAFVFACGAAGKVSAQKKTKAKTHVIEIKNYVFTPAAMTVNVGDTVIWKNGDIVPHTATGKGFDSGSIAPGASWRFIVRKKGNFAYICTFHPTMKGTLIVK